MCVGWGTKTRQAGLASNATQRNAAQAQRRTNFSISVTADHPPTHPSRRQQPTAASLPAFAFPPPFLSLPANCVMTDYVTLWPGPAVHDTDMHATPTPCPRSAAPSSSGTMLYCTVYCTNILYCTHPGLYVTVSHCEEASEKRYCTVLNGVLHKFKPMDEWTNQSISTRILLCLLWRTCVLVGCLLANRKF